MKRISFTVSDDKVGTIVTLIINEIENLVVENLVEDKFADSRIKARYSKHFNKGETTDSAILQLAKSCGPAGFVKEQAENILKEKGYKPSSASPAITLLLRANKIRKLTDQRGTFYASN